MTSVSGSSFHASKRSFSEMSALFPRETTFEKPIFEVFAQSRTDVRRAPDCDIKLIFPFQGIFAEKDAFMGHDASIIPRQFGPSILMP